MSNNTVRRRRSSIKLGIKEKAAYCAGAFGKDAVYMLSAGYVLYYYQDILGVSAAVMGVILMAARVFDAFNDPVMGVLAAKTDTKWGRLRPWLLMGTLLNSAALYMMFSAPAALSGKGLAAYAAAVYILWGITYTMMDIPFWSMIPAFTSGGREREKLTSLVRSCAGAGAAVITVITVKSVHALGGSGGERAGFSRFSLIIAAAFTVIITVLCLCVKERGGGDIRTPSVREMLSALLANDQAMTVVTAVVLINCSLYITSDLAIYYFKYDFGGADWHSSFTLFNIFGGGVQILSMLLLFPLMRRFLSAVKVFYAGLAMAVSGYALLLVIMFFGRKSVIMLMLPAFFIFAAFGILTVLTTVFLANTVDYGEYKNGRRDESVIFSMQTLVVKLASGAAALIASLCIGASGLGGDTPAGDTVPLRLTMTLLPAAGMAAAWIIFRKRFILGEEKLREISAKISCQD